MAKGNLPRWSSPGLINGVQSIHLRQWKYFIDYIFYKLKTPSDYIFRGHRKDTYKLESTLDRAIKDKSLIPQVRADLLEEFKVSIRGKRGPNPIQYSQDADYWALGQHYGLHTPLLDWSHSPFVAAYFAFSQVKSDDTKKRVIFALNKTLIERKCKEMMFNEIAFFKPITDENTRVLNQNGLFSSSESGLELESWITQTFQGSQDSLLLKFYIPKEERRSCLTALDTMNINHITLFPDLYGASVYTNMKVLNI